MTSLLRTASRIRPSIARQLPRKLSPTHTPAFHRSYASNTEQPYFPNEPREPTVKTAIPGPESKKAIEALGKVFDIRSLNMMADYGSSIGN